METKVERAVQKRQVLFLCVFLGVSWASTEPLRYFVAEETERGTFLANLAKDLGLGAGELSARGSRIFSDQKILLLLFNPLTGDLILNDKLDREELCGPTEPCVLPFQLLLEKPFQIFSAELWVRDINDHSPVFLEKEISLEILESTTPGSTFLLESAQDSDVGSNNLKNYTISSNAYFHINVHDSGEGTIYPELVLDRALDREKVPELSLTLTAIDGGSPPRSGTTQVHIQVVDVNDNAPQFEHSLYKVQVPENSPIGSLVITSARTMEASGKLICRQRQVLFFFLFLGLCLAGTEPRRYSVVEETEGPSFVTNLAKDLGLGQRELSRRGARVTSKGNKLHLQLDQENGDLLLHEKLDREELCGHTEPCVLRFQVLLENPLEFFQVELQVIDINDHAPEFLDRDVLLKISESSPTGARFPLKSARDMDVGQNNIENYIISPNAYFRVLTRQRSDGGKYPELVMDKALDREEEPELRLMLTAQDGGSPPRTGTAHVYIEVLDINDNAPEFEQSLYRVRIPEDSPIGSLIVTVSATDVDLGINGEISYSIFQPSEEIGKTFEIDSITGEIRLKKQLDFEKIQSYEINIEAKDAGSFSGKCTVVTQVIDVNDNVPEITMSAITRQIPENSPETVVAVFSVSDSDSEENGKITCFIQDDLPFLLKSSLPDAHFPGHLLDVSGAGTLSHSYQYEVCLAGGADTNEFKFLKPILPNFQGHSPGPEIEENPNFQKDFNFSIQ
nr:unnamed protein product [Sorex araneus]